MLNLPAINEDMDEQQLAALIGQQFRTTLPTLGVNYADEIGPRGQFTIQVDGEYYFSKSCLFRPMFGTFQYRYYNANEPKQSKVSVHFRSFSDEIPDSSGGYKCGKLSKKARADLTKEEAEFQAKIKLNRILFGTATFEGVDAVKDIPCRIYVKGDSFIPVEDYLRNLDKQKVLWYNNVIKFDTQMQKTGSVTHWNLVPSNGGSIKSDRTIINLITDFAALVKHENSEIMDKWTAARAKKSTNNDMKAIASHLIDVSDSLELNDDIPM